MFLGRWLALALGDTSLDNLKLVLPQLQFMFGLLEHSDVDCDAYRPALHQYLSLLRRYLARNGRSW